MRRSYLKCPYCSKDTALQGINMHVKVQHPDKHAEFVKNYENLKKTAVVKEIVTTKSGKKPEPAPGPVPGPAAPGPAAAQVKQKRVRKPPVKPPAKPPEDTDPGRNEAPGGEAPQPGQGGTEKSFLEEVSDGILDWINTP